MSEEQATPSEETPAPVTSGDGAALPESSVTPATDTPEKKRTLAQKIRRFAFKTVKATALLTAITAPIRGTPGNMLLRGLQTTGVLPTVSNVDGLEIPYNHTVDSGFANSIQVARLPDVPLQPATIHNIVMEPNGEDIPVYLLHGESIGVGEAIYRTNTTLYHAQNVASSYHHTLKKITGHEPNVRLMDGLVSEGIFFNGPHHALLTQDKTIVNNSVCISSLDQTDDSSQYRAWLFHAAGNLGDDVDGSSFQPQPGGISYHGPRSVLVGAPYHYSSHCGPVFYSDTPRGGRVKSNDARLSFLPSAVNDARRDSDGREEIYMGWGGTSNASPSAAAKFSALMERYGNYLSEEQIFTALCYATAQSTQARLQNGIAEAMSLGFKDKAAQMQSTLDQYHSTTQPGRNNVHFYDPLSRGFGEITQTSIETADQLCQDMIRYRMERPQAVCPPVTYTASLCLGDQCRKDSDGLYHYIAWLPETVHLNNMVIRGTAATGTLDNESLYLVANQLKIRIPAGTTSAWREYAGTSGDTTPFIGSTRGFTASGATNCIEVLSSVPLADDTTLTCYNTLARDDAVGQIPNLRSYLDQWQSMGITHALADATPLDSQAIQPQFHNSLLAMAPAGIDDAIIASALRKKQEIPAPEAPSREAPDTPQQTAYWRRSQAERMVRRDDPVGRMA